MASPETLAELGQKAVHGLEVYLEWCRSGRTGPLTFHFSDGTPQVAEASDKVTLGEDREDRPLTVVE